MNLAIDIGNSFSKIGIFDAGNKVLVSSLPEISNKVLHELIAKHELTHIIYSSVKEESDALLKLSKTTNIYIHKLTHKSNIPIRINYSTPDTLGADRIAGVVSAYNKFSDNNVLVIDAGTAVTFDILSSKGIYEGGNISPGLSMRFRSLNTFTDNLPLVSPDNKYDIIGKDTDSAIRSGVQQGLIFEINEYIRTFKNSYKDLKIIITGGDGKLLSGQLDHKIVYSPDLVIEGLNFIVNYNA